MNASLLVLSLATVAAAPNDVLYDFYSTHCGPCQMMAPQFSQAAVQLEPRVRLAKLNTDAEAGVAGEFNIRSIPTLALFKSGREINRRSGAMGTADIVNWVRSLTS